jgi:hypothetical protein
MAQRIPVGFRAEYRGQAPAGSFTNRETGEVVPLAANFKFEYVLADGEPDTISIRQGALDKVAGFDVGSLKKGEEVYIEGVVVLGGENGGFFRAITFKRASAPSAARAA